MILNLLLNNNLEFYYILIGFRLILCCIFYYLIKNNKNKNKNTVILIRNIKAFTYEEMAIVMSHNENRVIVSNETNETYEDIDIFLIDNDPDYDPDVESVYYSSFDSDSDSSSDFNFDDNDILDDLNLFGPPIINVDFNVCTIQELKLFELSSLYARELEIHQISEEEIIEFISWFTDEQLASLWINDFFIWCITIM